MKKTNNFVVALLSVVAAILGLCTFIGILLVPAEISPPKQSAHENIEGVGYTKHPASKGLLLLSQNNTGIFVFLNFSTISTYLYVFPENARQNAELLPYVTDYTFCITPEFLASFCDRLAGIDMTDQTGEKVICFSPSILSFCEKKPTYDSLLQLCISFFDKFSKTGLSSEDFMFIIEETASDIPYSVCYDWIPYVKEMSQNIIY